jgi:glycosyltransferase involved in cell wall biosynthesis
MSRKNPIRWLYRTAAAGAGWMVVPRAQARTQSSQDIEAARSLRILVAAPQPFFQERGTPIAVRHVVQSLSDLGFTVDVLTFPLGRSPEIPGVTYHRVPNPLRFRSIPIGFSFRKVLLNVFLWRGLRRLLATGEFACVHAVEEAAFLAVLAARRHGIPVVYDMQSSIPEQLRRHWFLGFGPVHRLVERCERWLLRNSDRVACSAGLEDRVRRLVPDARVLRWAFPGTYQEHAMSFRAELRAELGIRSEQPVVIYTGNFAEYQGLGTLVAAIALVRKTYPQAVFVFVGASIEEAGAIGQKLASGVPAEAYRLVPQQAWTRMPRYLAAADIAVSPRQYGSNLPLKVIEYLAAGLPIVATDIPAHTTLLDDQIAVLVNSTPEGIAQGILGLLDDFDRHARYEAAARAYASEHFGQAAFLLSVAHLFDNIDGVGRPF